MKASGIDKLGANSHDTVLSRIKTSFQSDKVKDVDKKYVFYIIRLGG